MKTVLGIFILVSTYAPTQAPAANLGKVVGQLGLVEGEVYVDAKAVQKNASVREGSVVEVKNGHATLIIGKGSVFNLAADSKMVVSQYSEKTEAKNEGAELDLKFGRTRALILNQGGEKKDIRIKARAATMGVRGTEVFIDAPREANKPVQFFTLEGKADVTAHAGAPAVSVAQNQGVSTSGNAPANSDKGSAGGAKNTAAGAASAALSGSGGSSTGSANTGVAAATISISDVKAELKSAGLDTVVAQTIPPAAGAGATSANSPGSLSNSSGLGSLPPIQYDPIRDRTANPLTISPHFCNATTGVCAN